MINLTMVGKNVSFSLKLKKRNNKKKNKNPSKKFKKKKNKKTEKIQKRYNGLLKLLYSLSEKPDFFITLIYPKWFSSDEIIDQIKDDINKFNNRIRDFYKNSWFIFSIEYSPKSKIHLHMIGKVGRRKIQPTSKTIKRFKAKVIKWWARIIDSDEMQLSHVQFLKNSKMSDRRIGYLTKFKKKIYLGLLIEKFGKGWTYGKINSKNLPIAKPIRLIISEQKFNRFIRPALIKDTNKVKCRETSLHIQKLEKNLCMYHILNQPKKFKALLKKIWLRGVR